MNTGIGRTTLYARVLYSGLRARFASLTEQADALAWLAGEVHDGTGADEKHLRNGIAEIAAELEAVNAILVRLRQSCA